MDLLKTAVVDITTLTATCRALALSRGSLAGEQGLPHKLRERLQKELTQGVAAYIDALARSKRGVLDERQLASCRVAAERCMTRALRHQRRLEHLMNTTPGALLGVAAARQDLWRLAQMAIYLRQGTAAIRASGTALDEAALRKSGARLRRKLTRGLTAYARASRRGSGTEVHRIVVARKAALRAIGARGAAEAAQLVQFEADSGAADTLIRRGVVKPLEDLALDWGQVGI